MTVNKTFMIFPDTGNAHLWQWERKAVKRKRLFVYCLGTFLLS